MPVKEENTRIITTVTKEVKQQVSELADRERRTMSAMVALLIEKGIESYKKQLKDTNK